MQQALSSIEKRYAGDLFTAGAITEKPPLIHDEPEMIVTSASPAEQKPTGKPLDDAQVMRSARITLTADGDAAPAGGLRPISYAPSVGDAALGARPHVLMKPYAVKAEDCTALPFPEVGPMGVQLFMHFGEEQLLSAFIESQAVVAAKIQVQYVEKSEPVIWMARALASVPAEHLVLVPWISPLVRIVDDKTDKGIVLDSIKCPKHLLGGLPVVAVVKVACPSLDDEVLFAARSPLSGKQSFSEASSPFWCVQEAVEGDAALVNMECRMATVDFTTASFKIDDRPLKRNKNHQVAGQLSCLDELETLEAK